jgi:hypothetical protein
MLKDDNNNRIEGVDNHYYDDYRNWRVKSDVAWDVFSKYLMPSANGGMFFSVDSLDDNELKSTVIEGCSTKSIEEQMNCIKSATNRNNCRLISKEEYDSVLNFKKGLTDYKPYFFSMEFDIKGEVIQVPYMSSQGQSKMQAVNCVRVATNKYKYNDIDEETYNKLKAYIKDNNIKV